MRRDVEPVSVEQVAVRPWQVEEKLEKDLRKTRCRITVVW
jgi:hypothetical protein